MQNCIKYKLGLDIHYPTEFADEGLQSNLLLTQYFLKLSIMVHMLQVVKTPLLDIGHNISFTFYVFSEMITTFHEDSELPSTLCQGKYERDPLVLKV
jgi:hypothetical protein